MKGRGADEMRGFPDRGIQAEGSTIQPSFQHYPTAGRSEAVKLLPEAGREVRKWALQLGWVVRKPVFCLCDALCSRFPHRSVYRSQDVPRGNDVEPNSRSRSDVLGALSLLFSRQTDRWLRSPEGGACNVSVT